MKKIVFLLTVILFLCASAGTFAQNGKHKNKGMGFGQGAREKIEALEKAKLIDELNMSEELSVRFFAKRNDHMERMKKYDNELENTEDNLQKALDEGKNDQALKKLINDYRSTQEKIVKEKIQFLNSLSSILSTKQMAKYIVFENKFREEVRNIIMRERNKKMNKNN
jgi:hypothetical protein